ncbi:hypothetical protein [Aurantimonas sp. VKM B-3413]|uniref:hypothetical protein n=1 Tax=Aurantimonas sp. VKM B-3413 TaxID=2779401 RepID=UPI001E48D336|nr:hypothetical protein [Aurantimonas sp. VKM B-3413]MCB8836024.1 hypothetical protein [Aurantimonas sp. VKM B-3413]
MTLPALFIAAVSGLASALLFAGLVLQSGTAFGLALAAPIPVAIASLGWGSLAGLVAALTSGLAIYLLSGSVSSGLLLVIAMTGPIALAGHLAGLARPAANADAAASAPLGRSPAPAPLDWYPLDRVFLAIVLSVVAACIFLGWYLGYDPTELQPLIVAGLGQGGSDLGGASQDQIQEIARLVIAMVPFVQPAVLVVTLVAGLYLGALVVRISGRLPRPRDDVPTAGRLPQVALFIFAAGLAGSFVGGTIGLIADVVAGGFGAALSLVGLASVHKRTRGRPGRGLVLFTSYAAILLLSFPIALFLLIGIYETWKRRPRAAGPPPIPRA